MTIMLSGAVRGAARTLKDKMIRIAAQRLETDADGRRARRRAVCRAKGSPSTSMSMADVGMRAHLFNDDLPRGRETAVSSRRTPTTIPYVTLPSEDRKDLGAFYPMVSHACHIPVVEVDAETGES